MNASIFSALLLLFLAGPPARGTEVHATIVYDDVASSIQNARVDSSQLWITNADLKRATRFEVKPQGVCRDELCFPLPKARQDEFVHKDSAGSWFNLTAFAQLVHQPVAHDEAIDAWYFGLRSDQRQVMNSLSAPNFTLPDIDGKKHSLADFRGKKVILVTWASW